MSDIDRAAGTFVRELAGRANRAGRNATSFDVETSNGTKVSYEPATRGELLMLVGSISVNDVEVGSVLGRRTGVRRATRERTREARRQLMAVAPEVDGKWDSAMRGALTRRASQITKARADRLEQVADAALSREAYTRVAGSPGGIDAL